MITHSAVEGDLGLGSHFSWQPSRFAGRIFDRPIGSTKRGDRYAGCRIKTGFAFDRQICYATRDRKWSSGESRLFARVISAATNPRSGGQEGKETACRATSPDASREEIFQRTLEPTSNTMPLDITYHPDMNVPCGIINRLPVGMMLIGKHWHEPTIHQAAHAFEQSSDWKSMLPTSGRTTNSRFG